MEFSWQNSCRDYRKVHIFTHLAIFFTISPLFCIIFFFILDGEREHFVLRRIFLVSSPTLLVSAQLWDAENIPLWLNFLLSLSPIPIKTESSTLTAPNFWINVFWIQFVVTDLLHLCWTLSIWMSQGYSL